MVCSQQSPEKTDGHQSQERGGEGAREREREWERDLLWIGWQSERARLNSLRKDSQIQFKFLFLT